MKKVAIAAVVMLASVAAHAEDWFSFEAGLGATRYDTRNGRWFQENMPDNKVQYVAPEVSFGVTGPLLARGAWGIDWHVDYVNLGRAAAQCDCTPIDANYSVALERPLSKYNVDNAWYSGSGRAQGIALTVEPNYWFHGVRVGLDAGAYVYLGQWTESVSNWSLNQTMAKESFTVSSSKWSVAPVIGVTVGDGRWTLAFHHYFMRFTSNRLNVPPLWDDANIMEVKFKF